MKKRILFKINIKVVMVWCSDTSNVSYWGKNSRKERNCCSFVPSHQNAKRPQTQGSMGQERNMPQAFPRKANCTTKQGLQLNYNKETLDLKKLNKHLDSPHEHVCTSFVQMIKYKNTGIASYYVGADMFWLIPSTVPVVYRIRLPGFIS